MAIFQSLKTLATKIIQNPNSKSFHLYPSSHSPNPFPFPFPCHKTIPIPIRPLKGPLFLSCHCPWKLSQFATPLYQHSGSVFVIPKVYSHCHLPNAYDLGFGLSLDGGNNKEFKDFSGVGLKGGFINLPNFISLSRLVSGPFLGWMIIQEMYFPAFIGLAISGATDWLDGYVARKMGINSVVGSYLDPLADKVLIGCVALAMVDKGLLHSGLVGLIVVRDVALVGGAVYKRASNLEWEWKNWSDFFNLDGTRPQKVEPLFLSKVNTVFQLALVAAALLQPEFGTYETQPYITYLSWLVAATTISSTAAYGAQHLKSRPLLVRK